MRQLQAIFRKESSGYLNSSVALIFIGTFLILSLFFFFWVDKFFERNIADLRLFSDRLPMLLIFLVSALTMRSWAEERSQGTLELLLTWPVSLFRLVAGKFLGVLSLVALALALTFPLPITVEYFGNLDWGPVIAGYVGALLVASAYIAIGLFISALTANQIAALFLTAIICGVFYLLGSASVVQFAPNSVAEVLLSLGTGSRFDSIARGVLDVRDIVYYLSITFFFALLNIFALTQQGWSKSPAKGLEYHHRQWYFGLGLVFINLLALNLWLHPVYALRLDLTSRRDYTISKTTKNLLRNLREPLTIKFYASETHPLLKPLIPQTRDIIKEYQVVSRGRIRTEFVDPTTDSAAEKQANQDFGIKPVPFQVSGRNEAKIVNSYFNIALVYGDKHLVLNFDDLIEVNFSGMDRLEVKLRNPEYDLTRAIKKVVYEFQGVEELFAGISTPIKAQVIYTSKTLEGPLAEVPERIKKIYDEVSKKSEGKFTFEMVDLDDASSPISKKELTEKYDVKPFQISPFSRDTFYLHTLLHSGDSTRVLYPTGELAEKDIRADLEGALKRSSAGFLKNIGFWTPPPDQANFNPYNRGQGDETFRLVREILEVDYRVTDVNLSQGTVPKDIDVLLLIKPKMFKDKELFAVDQFLMEGGTVLAATGSYEMDVAPGGGLNVKEVVGGLEGLLSSYGIEVQKNLVMDLQNERFPVPVQRNIGGGVVIPQIQLIPYPFFIDVRRDGMVQSHPALASLDAVTLNWPSSLNLNEEKVKSKQLQPLMHSSAQSWLKTDGMDIQPNFELFPDAGFAVPEKMQPYVLAATLNGPLDSYFKGRTSPLSEEKVTQSTAKPEDGAPNAKPAKNEKKPGPSVLDKDLDQVIRKSPDSARLVVIGSGEFLSDRILGLSQRSGQERFRNSLVLAQNLIDWSLEDLDLLAIRSRSSYARTLRVGSAHAADLWSLGNYAAVLLSLIGLALYVRLRRKNVEPMKFNSGGASAVASSIREEKAA